MTEQILWTALITPFTDNGAKPDFNSLLHCLKKQEQALNGVILFGSTGEGLSLSIDEKKEILSFVFEQKLTIPIMVGVPNHNINEAHAFLSWANEFALDGYLMSTPIYTKPGAKGQSAWFKSLLDHANKKVMLYNIPSRTGVRLHQETLDTIKDHKNLFAIKDSDTLESTMSFMNTAPHLKIFAGDDAMMPAMSAIGAKGLISVVANAWPLATRLYVEHCLNGTYKSKDWWQACASLFLATNPIPIKALMKDVGLIAHDSVRLPLSTHDLKERAHFLKLHQKMLDWSN